MIDINLNTLELTPQQKMAKLIDLASIIAVNKDSEGNIPERIKHFCYGALTIIDECEESWCDSCPIRQQLNGKLCSEWIEF